MVVHSG